jgi:hypothetical protein
MFDNFFNDPALLIPTASIVCTALVFVVWIIALSWKRVRQLDIEAALKKEMLDRGMSAADIERVIGASTGRICRSPEGKQRSAFKSVEDAVRN